MNVGDVVAIAVKVGEDLQKIPALVTKVYENAHGEVVADLHRLETNVAGLVVKELNPAEALPPEGNAHVTTDLTPPENNATAAPAAAAQPAPAPAPAPTPTPAAPDAQLSSAESAFAALSDEDKAAFLERYGQQPQTEPAPADTASTTEGGGTVGIPGAGTGEPGA